MRHMNLGRLFLWTTPAAPQIPRGFALLSREIDCGEPYILCTVKVFFVLHDKVAILTRRRSERRTRNIVTKEFLERFQPYVHIYRKCWSKDEFFMTLMKLHSFVQGWNPPPPLS